MLSQLTSRDYNEVALVVHSQSIIIITAVKWNGLIFTIILHNFLNATIDIEQIIVLLKWEQV